MAIRSLSLSLLREGDDPFFPGDTISGYCQVNYDEAITTIRNEQDNSQPIIKIELHGKETVKNTDGSIVQEEVITIKSELYPKGIIPKTKPIFFYFSISNSLKQKSMLRQRYFHFHLKYPTMAL